MKTCPICNGPLRTTVTEWRDGDTLDYYCPITKVNLENGQSFFHYETYGLTDTTYIIIYPYRIVIEGDAGITNFHLYIPKQRAKQLGRDWDIILKQPVMSEQQAIRMLHKLKALRAFL
jgi:hypothetical protein